MGVVDVNSIYGSLIDPAIFSSSNVYIDPCLSSSYITVNGFCSSFNPSCYSDTSSFSNFATSIGVR